MGTKKITEKETALDRKIDRHPILYVFSFIILVIIVVTFLGSPIAGNLTSGTRIIFGKYDTKNIEYVPGNYLSEQKDILAQSLDKNSTEDLQYQAYQVWRGAFERTVIHTAILHIAEKSGIVVSDDKIDNTLVNNGPYTVDGEFSLERYNNTTRADRNSHRVNMKEALIKEVYIKDFFSGAKISSGEYDFISEMGKPEISLELAYISFDQYPESEVLSFARDNSDLFSSMELSKITVTSDLKDAEKIHSIVAANPDAFMDTAKNQSRDSYAENGGDMGKVYNYSVRMELKNRDDALKVFSLERNEITPVLETNTGWVIYKCGSPAGDPDFTDKTVLSDVRTYMNNFESGKIEDYFVAMANTVKGNSDFRGKALENGFSFYTTSSFPINYGNSILFKQISIENAPSELTQLNYNEDFLLESFSLEESEISEPVLLGNSLVIARLISKSVNESFSDIVSSYYPYILQQINDHTLTNFILRSDKLEDNFNYVFSKYFLNE